MAQAVNWGKMTALRRERLAKLLTLNAPTIVIDRECQMLRKAIHKSRNGWRLIWDDIVWRVREVLSSFRMDVEMWYWKRKGKTEEEAFDEIFGKE